MRLTPQWGFGQWNQSGRFILQDMSSISRRLTGLLASVATAATLLVAPVAAQAQSAMPAISSSDAGIAGSSQEGLRDSAWNTRNQVHQQTAVLHPQAANAVRGAYDAAVEGVFPGLINQRTEAARPKPQPAPAAAPVATPVTNTGPCPADAKVCVDLDGRRTWLQRNGQVYYGPVSHAPGKPGQETPRGTFWVNRKVKDEVSYLFNNAPMPYAVYFTYNGHAFHQGNLAYESAGCVRLNPNDAVTYFNELQIGDKVFIY